MGMMRSEVQQVRSSELLAAVGACVGEEWAEPGGVPPASPDQRGFACLRAMEASIRRFNQDDVEFALAQTEGEGWDPTAEFFETCLAHDPDGCFIAEAGAQRVGMVTTTRYGCTAWIGNLIVPAECRRQGLGRRLMSHAMAHLSRLGVRTLRLEADPPGVALYRRLGFVDEFESLRFGHSGWRGPRQGEAKPITRADLPAVAAFDAEHFGDDRARLLTLLFQRAKAAYGLHKGGQMRGYALAAPSRIGIRIGPWLAVDCRAAETLLLSILADWPDTGVILGVPGPNSEATALLESYGFKRLPPSCRMIHGRRAAAGCPESIFAIANGALG